MEQKFYICEQCGNIFVKIKDAKAPITCCKEVMRELFPGVIEAAVEKHIPVYEVDENQVKVEVGAVLHPMLPEHYIEWIFLKTKQGSQYKVLKPGEEPEVIFLLSEKDEIEKVYAYCNLHGLWEAK